ncbi:MAG: YqiA/YcfP family alpha/beta fold hydrolase [Synechococcus sp.]|nr:YqiA/YcfP family alpha/beta fold hydrolase [Synechococcus sp.]
MVRKVIAFHPKKTKILDDGLCCSFPRPMTRTLYLHGFASSPQSRKAQYFAENIPGLLIPDLNQEDFGSLTISRQLEQIQPLLIEPSYIIGSSLGGLTAAILAEQFPERVRKIILLAPAFQFTTHWRRRLGATTLIQWQREAYLPVFHYSYQQEIPLHYNFFKDAEAYANYSFQNTVPTLILHGIHDETVPITVSENYGKNRPWTTLISLDSDHSLGNCLDRLLQETEQFLFGV